MNKKTTTHSYMKKIVAVCIATVIVFAVASHVSAWFDVDTVPVLTIVAGIFGGELLLTVVLKLLEKPEPKKNKEA